MDKVYGGRDIGVIWMPEVYSEFRDVNLWMPVVYSEFRDVNLGIN